MANIKTGREQEALADIEEALRKDQRDPRAIDIKGFFLYGQGHYKDSLKELQKGISIKPDYAELWYHKGLAHFKLGQYDQAVQCYDEALSIQPRFAEAYNDKAAALPKKGDISGAIEQIKRAIELNPALSDAHINLGRLTQAIVKDIHNFWEFLNSSNEESYCNNVGCICIWYFSNLFCNFS